ncbi:MAG: FAD-dependent thymidylate synthase [Desulfobulbaceae bacterium]|nr:FAD-dependent thymidylate synthase [Desulfobulbaceae bacterium]
MKIIPPSYHILDFLDQQSLAVRIEYCGRICYKSEDKINQDSAIPFTRKMAEYGHNSVLEMGALTLKIEGSNRELLAELFAARPRYLQIDSPDESTLLVSGSVRAFREMLIFHPECRLVNCMADFLAGRHPYFFDTIIPEKGLQCDPALHIGKVGLEEVDRLPAPLLAGHRHLAVKFIVNRAITHEIVRHRPCSFLQESQRYCRYADSKFGNEVTFIKPLFYEEGTREYDLWQKAMEDTERIYLELLETSTPQAARTVLPNSCKTELIVYANLTEWKHIFKLRTTKAAEPTMREVMIPLHEEFQHRFPQVFTG